MINPKSTQKVQKEAMRFGNEAWKELQGEVKRQRHLLVVVGAVVALTYLVSGLCRDKDEDCCCSCRGGCCRFGDQTCCE